MPFQAYTELTWFRKFPDAAIINVTIFVLSDWYSKKAHANEGLKKLSFRHISLLAYTELVWFRKFQTALNVVITLFEFCDANLVGKDTIIGLQNKDLGS